MPSMKQVAEAPGNAVPSAGVISSDGNAVAAAVSNATVTPPASSSEIPAAESPATTPNDSTNNNEQTIINAPDSAKAKRKKSEEADATANSNSNKRRSLRDRNSITTPVAGKLSPMELIGSLTFDIAKAEEGWKVKEHRNGITRSFVSGCGKMTFDSFEAIGEFAIAKEDWMEKLADDEGAIDALQRLARDGDERAIGALESLGISVDEDEEEENAVIAAAVPAAASPEPAANAKGGKTSRVVIGLSKSDYTISNDKIAKFHDKQGEFLTLSVEMFFANFSSIVSAAETKFHVKNGPVLAEITKLQGELDDAIAKGERERAEKLRCDQKEKINESGKREKFHEKHVRLLVKELAEQFLATGFGLPEHIEKKYGDLIEKYPVLKEVAFATEKKKSAKKKTSAKKA